MGDTPLAMSGAASARPLVAGAGRRPALSQISARGHASTDHCALGYGGSIATSAVRPAKRAFTRDECPGLLQAKNQPLWLGRSFTRAGRAVGQRRLHFVDMTRGVLSVPMAHQKGYAPSTWYNTAYRLISDSRGSGVSRPTDSTDTPSSRLPGCGSNLVLRSCSHRRAPLHLHRRRPHQQHQPQRTLLWAVRVRGTGSCYWNGRWCDYRRSRGRGGYGRYPPASPGAAVAV